MKKKAKGPFIPSERKETIRQDLAAALIGGRLSAKELSAAVRIPEKEVYDHLDHIQKTMSKEGRTLDVTPAECRRCGFVFRKRERLRKPGRCPVCKAESINEPLFKIL